MNESTNSKPKYETSRDWLLADGSTRKGAPGPDVVGIRLTLPSGPVDVQFAQFSAYQAQLAQVALADAFQSVLGGVVKASEAETNAGKSLDEIAQANIAHRVAKLAAGEISGIRTGDASVPIFTLIVARMTNKPEKPVTVADAARALEAKEKEMGEEAYKTWAAGVRQSQTYKIAKAQYDLERANAAQGGAELDLDF